MQEEKLLSNTRLNILTSICDYFICLNILTVLKFVNVYHLSRWSQSLLLGQVRKTYLVLLSVQQLAFHYQPQTQILAQDPSSFPPSEGLEGLFGSSLFEGLQMWLIVSCDCGEKKKDGKRKKKSLKHDFVVSAWAKQILQRYEMNIWNVLTIGTKTST